MGDEVGGGPTELLNPGPMGALCVAALLKSKVIKVKTLLFQLYIFSCTRQPY